MGEQRDWAWISSRNVRLMFATASAQPPASQLRFGLESTANCPAQRLCTHMYIKYMLKPVPTRTSGFRHPDHLIRHLRGTWDPKSGDRTIRQSQGFACGGNVTDWLVSYAHVFRAPPTSEARPRQGWSRLLGPTSSQPARIETLGTRPITHRLDTQGLLSMTLYSTCMCPTSLLQRAGLHITPSIGTRCVGLRLDRTTCNSFATLVRSLASFAARSFARQT